MQKTKIQERRNLLEVEGGGAVPSRRYGSGIHNASPLWKSSHDPPWRFLEVTTESSLCPRPYGLGEGGPALSGFSGAKNFRAIVMPMRIICNWLVWN